MILFHCFNLGRVSNNIGFSIIFFIFSFASLSEGPLCRGVITYLWCFWFCNVQINGTVGAATTVVASPVSAKASFSTGIIYPSGWEKAAFIGAANNPPHQLLVSRMLRMSQCPITSTQLNSAYLNQCDHYDEEKYRLSFGDCLMVFCMYVGIRAVCRSMISNWRQASLLRERWLMWSDWDTTRPTSTERWSPRMNSARSPRKCENFGF